MCWKIKQRCLLIKQSHRDSNSGQVSEKHKCCQCVVSPFLAQDTTLSRRNIVGWSGSLLCLVEWFKIVFRRWLLKNQHNEDSNPWQLGEKHKRPLPSLFVQEQTKKYCWSITLDKSFSRTIKFFSSHDRVVVVIRADRNLWRALIASEEVSPDQLVPIFLQLSSKVLLTRQ